MHRAFTTRRPYQAALLTILLLIAALAASPRQPAAAQGQPGLFGDAPALDGPAQQRQGVARARQVLLRRDLLGDQRRGFARRITLNLFDDARYTAVLEGVQQLGPDRFVWSGRLEGIDGGYVNLAVNAEAAAASITAGERSYELRYQGQGSYAIEQIDPGAQRVDAEPLLDPANQRLGPEQAPPPADVQAGASGPTIDVLVLYTPAAKARYASLGGIEARIDVAMADTNQAYQNSQVGQRVQLVHVEEVAYTEYGSDSSSIAQDLYRLTNSDGHIDQAHTLRDLYAADIVVLITGYASGGFCGIAWQMSTLSVTFEDRAFAVVNDDCAIATQNSFAHELGHVMGLAHDPSNAGNLPAFSYGYGYRVPGQFRTIMAYQCGSPCPRQRYFSNPNVTYNSMPTGLPSNDPSAGYEALALNNSAATVAAFRVAVVDLDNTAYLPLLSHE